MYNTQHLPKPIVETKPPIITMEQVKYVYKILPSSPPEPLPALYPLSALDHADGFVHLSTNNQVPATCDLFFAAASCLWLLKLEVGKLVDTVKWEDGFPHLYGNFGANDVQSVRKFERLDHQSWADSMRDSSWLN